MRYVDHGAGGAADVLQLVEGPRPEPGPGEVLIRVACAGVNRPDVLQRSGSYPPPADASPVLGLEVSGHCEQVGAGCTRRQVGDAVCALVPGGGYAEFCVVPEAHCLPLPAGLSLAVAASLPEVCFTVWANVFERGQLRAGQRLLVHGGSSGIGVMAIQLARAFGAQVAVTVGNEQKQDICRELGAEIVVNYHRQDFVALVRERWGAVELVLDMIGGDYAARNIALLAPEGRLVQIAVLGGAQAELNLAQVMVKRLTITGSTLRARSDEEKARLARALEKQVWPLLATASVRPVIHKIYMWEQVAEAHRDMERSQHIGKLVLAVSARQQAALGVRS